MKGPNWKSDFAETWLKYWPPPARPTKNRLIFIRKILKEKIKKVGKKNFQLLILGSTSEFRDMMIELDISPVVVDFNEANYHILAKKMRHYSKYPKNENFVQSDWLNMKLDKKFDVIITDNGLSMLLKKDSNKFFKNINFHLKDKGVYIDTIFFQEPKDRTFDIRKEIKKKKNILKEFTLYEAFSATLYLTVYDYKNHVGKMEETPKIIKKLYQEGLITKKQLNDFNRLQMNKHKFRFFMPFRSWLDNMLKKYFIVEKKWRETDKRYPWQYFATFVLRKR